jgi:cytochrome c
MTDLKLACALLVAMLALPASARAGQTDDEAAIANGREFVRQNCARCHAVESTGESPHAKAPPFRTIGQKYPIESLAEAFAEGIVVGHKDMPVFELAPWQIREVLGYIESIQAAPPHR